MARTERGDAAGVAEPRPGDVNTRDSVLAWAELHAAARAGETLRPVEPLR